VTPGQNPHTKFREEKLQDERKMEEGEMPRLWLKGNFILQKKRPVLLV